MGAIAIGDVRVVGGTKPYPVDGGARIHTVRAVAGFLSAYTGARRFFGQDEGFLDSRLGKKKQRVAVHDVICRHNHAHVDTFHESDDASLQLHH